MSVHKIKSIESIGIEVRGKRYDLVIPSALKLKKFYDEASKKGVNPVVASINFLVDSGLKKEVAEELQSYEMEQICEILAGKIKAK